MYSRRRNSPAEGAEMIRDDNQTNWFGLASVAIVVCLVLGHRESVNHEPAPSAEISQGMFSDVRIKLDSKTHGILSDFIRTGKLNRDRIGVDMTQVESIRCLPGRLVFSPPIRVKYDGPGPLNAGTTIKEIRLGADGEILVDVVNSPIDLIIEE